MEESLGRVSNEGIFSQAFNRKIFGGQQSMLSDLSPSPCCHLANDTEASLAITPDYSAALLSRLLNSSFELHSIK